MTKAAPIVKDYNISSAYLRAYLMTMRKVTGAQYPRLLEKAGLSEYAEKDPPIDYKPAAKGDNFMRLIQQITQTLDPELYELFQKNVGREFARAVIANPRIQAEIQKIGAYTDPANLELLMNTLISFNNQTIDQKVSIGSPENPIVSKALTGVKSGVVLLYKNCIYCAHLETADKPMCQSVVNYYKEIIGLLPSIIGSGSLRLTVDEIYCAAKEHSTDCYFLIKRS